MTADTLALALAGVAIMLALPPVVWVYLWGVRR